MAKIVDLEQVETYWSLMDYCDAHDMLDLQDAISPEPGDK